MRVFRLVLLLLLGLATVPASAHPACHAAPAPSHHMTGHHRTAHRHDDAAPLAIACIGCAIVAPEPAAIPMPPQPVVPAYAAAAIAALSGRHPAATSPPPRAVA